jgi:GNAT superfamily N-acetyltransferase
MKIEQAALTIRPAIDNDKPILEQLIAKCYAEVYPGWYDRHILAEALPIMLKIDPKLLHSGRYFVANANDVAVGCGGWSVSAPGIEVNEISVGHIRHFATDPKHMGRGVGGAILNQCIIEAQRLGVRTLKCFSSLPAQGFYARYGFEKPTRVNVMLGESNPFPAIMMERRLNS